MSNPHNDLGLHLLDDVQAKIANERNADILLLVIMLVCAIVFACAR